jgi:hypothetical protein
MNDPWIISLRILIHPYTSPFISEPVGAPFTAEAGRGVGEATLEFGNVAEWGLAEAPRHSQTEEVTTVCW